MISEKQKIILDFAIKHNNQVSSKDALFIIGHNYFLNAPKYVGEFLSRMVKSKLLKRIKKGLFEVQNKQTVSNITNPNQLQLL